MLSEAMLACAGVINRMGSIAAGSTVSDYHDSEQQRQISVLSTLMHLEWQGKKFNVLDCPGYADFISEGIDQSRGWFYSLLAISTFVTGKSPYRRVLTTVRFEEKSK